MGNLIVIDGPRGSGKTTLVDGVVRSAHEAGIHHVNQIKMTRPDKVFLQMHQFLCEVEKHQDLIYVVDRFSLTEYVMSEFYQRVNQVELISRIETIQRRLREIDAFYFVLFTRTDVLEKRINSRDADRQWDIPKNQVGLYWGQAFQIFRDGLTRLESNDQQDYQSNKDFIVGKIEAYQNAQ